MNSIQTEYHESGYETRQLDMKDSFMKIIHSHEKAESKGDIIKEQIYSKVITENAKTLTFSLGDGGRGRDGAEGGTAWVGRVSPGHGHGVTDPCCRVNGSDRLICRVRKTIRKHLLTQTWIRMFCV